MASRGVAPWKRATAIGIIAGIALLALFVGVLSRPAERPVGVGAAAPDFVVEDLDGNELALSDLKGKVVLLNFWATYCPPCRYEMPDMQALYEEYKDRGLAIVAVNYREPPATVRGFNREFGLTFPIGLDRDGSVNDMYQTRSLPTSYFVDRDGIIRYEVWGAMSYEQMENRVLRLL